MTTNMEYCGTSYDGTLKAGKFDGHGTYEFPGGMKYVGQFKMGYFHGDGVIYHKHGSYRCKFDMGKEVEGTFIFNDGLIFEDKEWPYCTTADRRFHTEIEGEGVKPAGECQVANAVDPPALPVGCYDVADGYYNPDSCKVHSYETGEELREPAAKEVDWILSKCRVGVAPVSAVVR